MKKLTKIVVSLFASFAITSSAYSLEMTVSGTAKATYGTLSGWNNGSNALGLANELGFGASGELDNGWTVSYNVALDPDTTAAGGNALNDDASLKVTTPYGLFSICASDCGISAAGDFNSNAYAWITDTAYDEGKQEPVSLSGYMNIQYSTAAGLLPFGIVGTVGYAHNSDTSLRSTNAGSVATQTATTTASTAYKISAKPVDGLSVSASYSTQDGGEATGSSDEQKSEGGAIAAKYSAGPVTVGVGRSWVAPRLADGTSAGATTIEHYTNTNVSIGFAVNENLSVSYSNESSEPQYMTSTTTHYDQDTRSIQGAYTMGGMTLALAHTNYDNVGYTTRRDVQETIVAVTLAF
jgi:hypothetical protein